MRCRKYVLVTGATGFIGAHVVDQLLRRGLKVRGATRTLAKGRAMMEARPQCASSLDFVEIDDFENPGRLDDAVRDVDAVIHVASVSDATWTVPGRPALPLLFRALFRK